VGNATFSHIPLSAASYAAAIEGLTRLDEHILRGDLEGPGGPSKFPPLYQSGVRYKREPRDVWRHIGDVMASGWGDCEDLAAARAAELRVSGEDENARVGVYQSGPRRFHAIVIRGDETMEDPSRKLGMLPHGRSPMGKLEGASMHDEKQAKRERHQQSRRMLRHCIKTFRREPIGTDGAWIGVGDDPLGGDPRVTFDLYRSGKGWSGIVRIPLQAIQGQTPKAIIAKTTRTPTRRRTSARPTSRARARRRTKQKTATKAINLAARIAQNPMVQTLVPPQARVALKVLKSPLGKLARKGAGKLLSKLF